jgi:tetratricopeptide (TPR) repeat protein
VGWLAALILTVAAPRELPPPPGGGLEPAIARQLSDARSAVERMIADGGTAPRDLAAAYGSLGELYLLYDLAREAQACLREASTLDPAEPRWPYLLGVVLQGEGDLEGAAAQFRATLALRPDDVPALLRLGDVLLDRALIEPGRDAFARALAADPSSAKALDGLGRAAFAAGDHATAVSRFEAALRAQPAATSVRYRLALVLRAQGEIERSRAELARSGQAPVTFADPVLDASRRRVTGVGAMILVAQIAARAEAFATAEARFRDAITLDAESAEAHHALGAFLEERGRAREAVEEYVAALDLGLANAGLALHTARMLNEAGRAREAVAILERVQSDAPDSSLVTIELASSLQATGERERALAVYDRALEHGLAAGERATLLFHRANLYDSAGDAARAEADLREAVRLEPGLAAAHSNLGTLSARRGDLAEAAIHLGRAVDLEPENAQAQLSLGMALLLLDRPLDARERLESAWIALPGVEPIGHLLARILATTSVDAARDPERALMIADELVKMRPDAGPHLETLAMALAALGRYDEAAAVQVRTIEALEKLIASSPGNLTAAIGAELEAARRRLALYRAGRPVVDPWKG